MKQKDILALVVIAVFAALFSAIFAGKIFKPDDGHKLSAPVVEPISSEFPDIKNDSAYNTFFNDKAIDPTQLIKIGTSNNDTPF